MSEWKKVRIGDFLIESKILSEKSDAEHRITVRLNCKGVEQREIKVEKEGATKYYVRKAGQFIYGKQNIHKGAFGIIPQSLDGFTSSSDLPAFDIDKTKCVPDWICLYLKSDDYYKKLEKLITGVGSKRLSVEKFLEIEIPLPDLQVQKEIIGRISSIELLEAEIRKQQNYIGELKQNLLREVFEEAL